MKRIILFIVFIYLTINSQAQTLPVSSGIGSTYVLTIPGEVSLVPGLTVKFQANVACLSNPTIDVNSTGSVNIYNPSGVQLAAGAIAANQVVELVYDGGVWQMISSPGTPTGSSGNWELDGNTEGTVKSLGTTDANDLPFITGNAERMRITSAGKVGIGTIAPINKLDLVGNLGMMDNDIYFRPGSFGSPDINHGLGWYGTPSKTWNGFDVNGPVLYGNGGGVLGTYNGGTQKNVLTWNDQGKVGIGTSGPGTALHVSGSGNIFIQAETQSGGTPVGYMLKSPTREWYLLNQPGGSDRLSFYDATSVSERLVIDGPTGNIGIGTATPDASALLEINSTSKGFLVPKVALTGTAISGPITLPATGLIVYNTATSGSAPTNVLPGYYYNAGTPATPDWKRLSTGNGDGWSTTGNAGTVDGTHFIGTTDDIPFNIRVNNLHAARITSNGNSFYGIEAGNATSNGFSNTAIGAFALNANVDGRNATAIGTYAMYYANNQAGIFTNYNVAVGYEALRGSPSPFANTGNWNTAIGYQSLINNAAGNNNTANGYQSLFSNINGINNTANGYEALYSNTSGNSNTANGLYSLAANNTGHNNTASGAGALYSNTAGSDATAIGYNAMYYSNDQGGAFTNYNVAVGYEALRGSTSASANTGNNNTALGYQTLLNNTSGSSNTAIGKFALNANSAASNNTAIGVSAMQANTYATQNVAIGKDALLTQSYFNGTVPWATNNVAIGYGALRLNQPTSNINGYQNTAVGSSSLGNNTTGSNNAALGKDALLGNTTGSSNTAAGASALAFNNTGGNNAAFGYGALTASTTASNNTAVGSSALVSNITAPDNTAVGSNSMAGNTYASQNVAIGRDALLTQSFANGSTIWATNNVAIGYRALRLNQPTSNTNGYQNTAVGTLALAANTTGTGNVATGYNTLATNNTGNYNTATGHNALTANTTGADNAAYGVNSMLTNNIGIQNASFGAASLQSNTTGSNNAAIGRSSLYSNTVGISNTASGAGALFSNVAGSNSTAIGFQAMYYANSSATPFNTNNVAVGYEALKGSTSPAANTGIDNTSTGFQAMYGNTVGSDNVANGSLALNANTASSENVAIGSAAMALQSYNNGGTAYTGQNTAIGTGALYSNQPTNTSNGWRNTATGYNALFANTIGGKNVATGAGALSANTIADNNTAVGYFAMPANTTAGGNVAIGYNALLTQSFSNAGVAYSTYNTAVGYAALNFNQPTSNVNGLKNTALGYFALVSNTTGSNNVGVGANAGNGITFGNANVLIGVDAGSVGTALTTGSNNTLVGYQAQFSGGGTWSNSIALGSIPFAISAANMARIGNASTTSIGGQVGWTTISDARTKVNVQEDVVGLDFIRSLRPVTYHYNRKKELELMGMKDDGQDNEWKNEMEKIQFSGFLAQEVDAAAKQVGYNFSGVDKIAPVWGLRYSDFVVPLVKAIQEMDKENKELKNKLLLQQNNVDQVMKENASLKSDIEKIKAQLGIDIEVKK